MGKSDELELCDHPDWLAPVFRYLDAHQSEFRVGVYGLAKRVLRMIESDHTIQTPMMGVGRSFNFVMKWEFSNGVDLTIDFISSLEFRYRHQTCTMDSGTVLVNMNYGNRIRKLFRDVFGVNMVTRESMVFHLGKGFK
jgi:hypothetical protein